MKFVRIVAIAACALAPTFPHTALSATDVADPVLVRATEIRDRFVTAMRDCGVEPPFVPEVIVDSHPSIVSYWHDDRAVHLSRWNEVPPDVQGMVSGWAASGTMGLGSEAMFGEIFNSLLVAHELGHYMHFISGRYRKIDNWEGEVEANRIAIAFWSLASDDAAKLPSRIANFNVFLEKLPNPVPANEDTRAYFVANYEKLGRDAMAYGWY